MKINKNSLQARIKNLSSQKGVPSNVILQDYFFDAFLKRLAKSQYVENFVFKGGFLLSTTLGIDFRSTMDMDFLLTKLPMNKENIEKIFKEIAEIDVDDNITFEFVDINDIRQEDEYGGFNVSLLGRLENVRVVVSIDIATGDPITPSSVSYHYRCLFDNEILTFAAYNFETIIAEKLQTILNRGVTNSRSKDFYDLYIIYKLRWDDINISTLKEAFNNTCRYRNTIFSSGYATEIKNQIENDLSMQKRWESFSKKNEFASDISFSDTISVLNIILETALK
jgi:predicted nucleotidyltransferase component of viral defense system